MQAVKRTTFKPERTTFKPEKETIYGTNDHL